MLSKEVIDESQNGFTMSKLCLANFFDFYDWVMVLEDDRRVTNMYLDLCKEFDSTLHYILVSTLERHGFDGWTAQGIKNWLDSDT
ncbi:hypothetical protein DUI87_11798 [Hirundo rustica rustica]|uniref:Uncharacterized protein n=1 Tax=Hirundo rustica rustica TaxID=333673 RepID=A0A3M0KEV9_HIRRU|nr:hypothetical protein DUI87_11798 [Hirundo rustica rustica]